MLLVDEKNKANLSLIDNFTVQVQMSIFSNGSQYTAYLCADLGKFHCFNIGLTAHDIEELNSELQGAIEQVAASFEQNGINRDMLLPLAKKGNFAFKRIFAEGTPRETIREALKADATIQIAARDFAI